MEFRVLGPVEVLAAGRPLRVGAAQQRAVLAILLLQANEIVASEQLIDRLWGERPPATARTTLQTYVLRLRRRGLGQALLTRPPGYLLRVGPGELDLECFERLTGAAHQAAAAGDPRHASDLLHAALALWRGPALADVTCEYVSRVHAPRLEERRLAAVEARVEADLRLGRHDQLVAELEALVAAHPLRERLRGQLMVALYRSGQQARALMVYRAGRETLVDELGIEPGPALRGIEQAILTADPSLAAGASPRGRLPAPRLPHRFAPRSGGLGAAFPRQRTLHAALDWSYQRLDPRERNLFERLTRFSGPFTLQAAEARCAGGCVTREGVAGLLDSLVERSIVMAAPDPGRFWLLDGVRRYGAERARRHGRGRAGRPAGRPAASRRDAYEAPQVAKPAAESADSA